MGLFFLVLASAICRSTTSASATGIYACALIIDCGFYSRTATISLIAPSMLEDGVAVGHVPYNLTPRFSQFLMRNVNKVFAELKGKEVKWGAGYEQEIPDT